MRVIDWPTISSAVYPNINSAARFQEVTMPFRSFPTIASSDEPAIAASQKRESSGDNRPVAAAGPSAKDTDCPDPPGAAYGASCAEIFRRDGRATSTAGTTSDILLFPK
jgi:hypothetical protein